MRIIAGTHCSRKILGPADEKITRPITDRVKTALFDRLASAGRLKDAVVLDLFCGTGSMGLECLSRGARSVVFVDKDREALKRLKQNLELLRETDKAVVSGGNALGADLGAVIGGANPTLIFCDPPYALVKEHPARVYQQMERIAGWSRPGALLVLRCEVHEEPALVAGWSAPRTYPYGSMALHFYTQAAEESGAGATPPAEG